MVWFEPLNLRVVITQIFAGGSEYFTAIALLFIAALAGFFRMTALTLVFMVGIFFVMFVGYVDVSLYYLLITLTALLIGYWISRIVKN